MARRPLVQIKLGIFHLQSAGINPKVDLDYSRAVITVFHPSELKRIARVQCLGRGKYITDLRVVQGEVDGHGKGSLIKSEKFTAWLYKNNYPYENEKNGFSAFHHTDTVPIAKVKEISKGPNKDLYRILSGDVNGKKRGEYVDEDTLLLWIENTYK